MRGLRSGCSLLRGALRALSPWAPLLLLATSCGDAPHPPAAAPGATPAARVVGLLPPMPPLGAPDAPPIAPDPSLSTWAEAIQAASARFAVQDGRGCVAAFERAALLGLPARKDLDAVHARCVMLAGQCDRGMDLFRQSLARTADPNANWPSPAPDAEITVRDEANLRCPAVTAKGAVDYAYRASHEMARAVSARSGELCRAVFDRLEAALPHAIQESVPSHFIDKRLAQEALASGARCIAASSGRCSDGLAYWRRYYAAVFAGDPKMMPIADESWNTLTKIQHSIRCE